MANYCGHCGQVYDRIPSELSFGDLKISSHGMRLICGDRVAFLSPQEGNVMRDLMGGKPVSNDALMMRYFQDIGEKVVHVFMSKLRVKLENIHSNVRIENLWAYGHELSYAGEGPVIKMGDLVLDTERMALFRDAYSICVSENVMLILKELMTKAFVPLEETAARLFPNQKYSKQQFRMHLCNARRALLTVDSSCTIITTFPKFVEGAKSGYWLKSSGFVDLDLKKVEGKPGGRGKSNMRVSITTKETEFLELLKQKPLERIENLAKEFSCDRMSAYRYYKSLRIKGFIKDIEKQRKEAEKKKLTPLQAKAVNHLRHNPGATNAQICDSFGISRGGITGCLERLIAKGIICKKRFNYYLTEEDDEYTDRSEEPCIQGTNILQQVDREGQLSLQ